MTVSNTQRRYTYLADGVTRDWPIEFSYLDDTDVIVYHIAEDGTETQIENITVVGAVVTAPATGDVFATGSVRVERVLPYTQTDDFTTQGAFSPEDMERTADKLTMVAQQIRDVAEDTEQYVYENMGTIEDWKDDAEAAAALAVASKERAVLAEGAAQAAQGLAEGARDKAAEWAEKTDGAVEAGSYSAKKHAVDAASSAASALSDKDLAEAARDAAVTAKGQSENARDASVTAKGLAEAARDLAEDWANKTDGPVDGLEYSAKKYAGDANTAKTAAETAKGLAETAQGLAEDWATKTDGMVDGLEYSAKKYAGDANTAKTAAETAQGKAEEARDAAVAIAALDSPALSGTPTTPTPAPGTTTTQIVNAEFIDDEFGARAKTTSTASKIPIADENGKLESAWIKDASATVKGIVELATDAEVIQGTDNERAVTPAGFKAAFGEFYPTGVTPTYVDANNFSVTGDQTAIFTKGRVLKITDTGGTVYAVVSASVYDTVTTVTIAGDTIDSGISAVLYAVQQHTSAIWESGSNANGSYVKFVDGTMTCTQYISFADNGLSFSKDSFSSNWWARKDLTFPAAFSANPKGLSASVKNDTGMGWASVRTTGTNIIEISIYDDRDRSGQAITYSYTAIGRWY